MRFRSEKIQNQATVVSYLPLSSFDLNECQYSRQADCNEGSAMMVSSCLFPHSSSNQNTTTENKNITTEIRDTFL